MKKENLIIGAILVLFVLFIGSCKFKNPNVSQERIDTLRVKALFEKANKLKESNPDSALLIYDQVIHLIPAKVNSFSVLHYLGLSYSKKAATYCGKGDYNKSHFNDSLSISYATKMNDKEVICLSKNLRGLTFYQQGDYSNAVKYYEEAIAIAKSIKDEELLAKIYTNRAIIYYIQGDVQGAINRFKTVLSIGKKLKNGDLQAASYLNLALIYANNGDNDLTISMYKNAIPFYQQKNEISSLVLCYQCIAKIYYTTNQFDKAQDYFQLSLNSALQINNQIGIAKGYHNLGELRSCLGDYPAAMKYYMKAIKIKEKLNDQQGISIDYANIGNIYFLQGDYKRAEEYKRKALNISLKIKDAANTAIFYTDLSNIYMQRNDNKTAIEYLEKSLDNNIKIDNKSGISDAYYALGIAYMQEHNFSMATNNYEKAIEMKEKTGEKDRLSDIYNSFSLLNFDEKHFPEALDYAKKSYAFAIEEQLPQQISNACLTLKKVYNAMGNTKQALKYADLYTTYNDSLFSQQKTEAITNAEAKWHSEKKQQQIEKLEAQRKLNQATIDQKTAESKLQKTFIIAIVLLLLLIVAIAFYVITNIRKRRDALYRKQLSDNISLKMQNARNSISPHFLFNMLSTISGMRNNPEMVETNTKKLSLLLRNVLENNDQTAIPLSKELETVSTFVDLQKLRIPEPFVVSFNVAEDVDTQTKVPAMIVQIPVENAIKHGLMPLQDRERQLSVNVSFENGNTKIIIENNGIGLKETNGQTAGTGTGLKVLLQTIHLLNEKNTGKILFSIKDKADLPSPERGTRVEIRIPADYSYNIN